MSSNAIGEIPVLITGDFAALDDAIRSAVSNAETGAQNIAQAFDIPSLGTEAARNIEAIGEAAASASSQMSLFGSEGSEALHEVSAQLSLFDPNGIEATDSAFGSLAVSAQDSVAPLEEAAHAEEDNTHALKELGEGLAEVGKGLIAAGVAAKELSEPFSEIASEAINLQGKIGFSETALKSFFGSAEQTEAVLSRLQQIEGSSIFDYPDLLTAAQHLGAMGLSAKDTASALDAAALAAEAVGGSTASIDSTGNALARVASTGEVSQRALMALGLSWQDIAKQMGVSAEQAKSELTGNLGDASQTIGILTGAIHAKFDQLGQDLQTSLPVALNKLHNEWDSTLESLGRTLVPIAIQVMGALKPILEALKVGAEYFGSLPGPIQGVVLGLGALAVAAGPVAIGLGAMFFAVGELTEGVPKVIAAIAELTATEEAASVAAGELATASEAAAVSLGHEAEAATAMGTASGAAAAGGVASLVGRLGALAAIVAGFNAGWFLGGVKDASAQLQEMSGYAHSLGVNLDQAGASGDGLAKAAERLTGIAKDLGITIDRADQSTEDYVLALLKAIKAHQSLAETGQEAGEKVSKALQSVTDEAKKNQATIDSLRTAVEALKTSYQNGTEVFKGHVATLAEVELAERKLKAALEAVNPAVKEQATHAKAVDTTWATVPDHASAVAIAVGKITSAMTEHNSKLQLAVEVYAKMKTDGVSSAEAVAEALKELEKEATAAGISHTKLASSITEAVAAAAGANVVWVNGKEVLVGLDNALKLAGDTAKQVVVPAFGDASDAGKDLTDTITVLTGSTNTQASTVSDATNQWVNLDGTLTRLSDILASLQAPMQSLTNETDAAAAAADQAAASYDRMAASASKASKSGGGDSFGSLAGKSVSSAEMLVLGLTTPFGIGSYITGGEQYQMAQELANMTGQVVQTNQGTFYPVVNGKSINPATGEPFAGQTPITPASSSSGSSGSSTTVTGAASTVTDAVQNLTQSLNTATPAVTGLAAATSTLDEKVKAAQNAFTDTNTVVDGGTASLSSLAQQIEALMGTLHVTNEDWGKANDLLLQASQSGDVVAEQLALMLRNQATGNALLIPVANAASGALSTLAGQIEGLFGTLRVNDADFQKANDLLTQAFQANDTVAEGLALALRNQATGNALTSTFGAGFNLPTTANLGTPPGGTLLNGSTLQININGPIYGQNGAQMVGQELTNALRTIASQKVF